MYNWLMPGVDIFKKMLASGRVPHAVLLTVARGLGGGQLAFELARRYLCLEQGSEDCTCRSCVYMSASTHPDYYIVGSDDKSSIGIEDVRLGIRALDDTAANNHGKVLYIEGAERMTVPAANALLKTLEEPPLGSLIILTTGSLQALLPTIISRCMRVTIPQPNPKMLNDFLCQELKTNENYDLELAVLGWSPLKVLACVQKKEHELIREGVQQACDAIVGKNSPTTVATFFDKKLTEPEQVYGILYSLIKEGLAYQSGVPATHLCLLKHRTDVLKALAKISPVSLSQALNRILALRQVPSIKTSYVNMLQLVSWFTLLSNAR